MRAVVAAGCVVLLVASACSDDAEHATTIAPETTTEATTTSTATTSTTTTPITTPPVPTSATSTTQPPPVSIIGDLPAGPCDGIGPAPPFMSVEVSLAIGGRMYTATPDGAGLQCALDLADAVPDLVGAPRVLWGPAADKLYVSGAVFDNSGPVALGFSDVPSAQWTRPTGKSIISIAADSLVKSPVGGGDPVDVSFLARHDEVVYYPSGTHIAVVGENQAGEYGIHFATNRGGDPRVMVVTDSAELSSPIFDHPGLFLYWIANADDVSHVHEIFALSPDDAEQVSLEDSIIFESERELSNLLVSPWVEADSGEPPLIAATEGRCEEGVQTITTEHNPIPAGLADFDNTPVGWLPDGRLVVASFPNGCALGQADIYLLSWDGNNRVPRSELFATGADGAAVRAPLPDPPPTPDSTFEGFA